MIVPPNIVIFAFCKHNNTEESVTSPESHLKIYGEENLLKRSKLHNFLTQQWSGYAGAASSTKHKVKYVMDFWGNAWYDIGNLSKQEICYNLWQCKIL